MPTPNNTTMQPDSRDALIDDVVTLASVLFSTEVPPDKLEYLERLLKTNAALLCMEQYVESRKPKSEREMVRVVFQEPSDGE